MESVGCADYTIGIFDGSCYVQDAWVHVNFSASFLQIASDRIWRLVLINCLAIQFLDVMELSFPKKTDFFARVRLRLGEENWLEVVEVARSLGSGVDNDVFREVYKNDATFMSVAMPMEMNSGTADDLRDRFAELAVELEKTPRPNGN